MSDVEVKARLSVDTGDSTQKVEAVKKGLQSTGQAAAGSTGSFSKLKGELASMQGPAGQVTQSLGLVGQALNVLKAHPIIGVFILIAGLVYALFQRFKQMEGVSDSLGKAWASLSGMFDTFVNYILTPLIDGFVTLVEWATKAAEFVVGVFSPSLAEAGKRSGELAEALDDLEDAETRSALARAESNRKLQEARELAADANVPIKQRIEALREAGRIEKQELENSIKIAQDRARIMTEQIAIELGARQELIDKIRSGNIEALKAARNELFAMQNVNKDKIKEIDALIIKAEDEGATLAKIEKKTQTSISSLQREEQAKREAAAKEAAQRRKQRMEEEKREREKAEKERLDALNKEIAEIKRRQDAEINYLREQRALEAQREKEKEEAKNRDIARQNAGLANQMANMQALRDRDAEDLAIEEVRTQARLTLKESIGGAIGALADLVGRQTALGKTLALAEIALGTGTGFIQGLDIAQKSAKATGPAAAFAFPIFYATQIAAVLAAAGRAKAALSSVRGGGASPSVSAPAIPTVSAPLTPQQQSTSINAGSIQALGNAAAGGVGRSYVLDSDISNATERNARIQRAASLG